MEYARVPMQETWQAMEKLADNGKARNIGLCNVNTQGLRDLLNYARIPPAVGDMLMPSASCGCLPPGRPSTVALRKAPP